MTLAMLLASTVGCRSGQTRHDGVRQTEFGMLASDISEVEANTYKVFQKAKTVGRFPCGLAIMRVTTEPSDNPDGDVGGTLMIDLLNEIKAVPWTELFDNYPAVTTVKVMGRPAVPFEQVTVRELVEAGRRQHAKLILVYGRTDLPAWLVRLDGALYDCKTGELVAVIHAQVQPVPGLPTPPDRIEEDKRHEDPECLTAERFQDLVLHCVDELVGLDAPATTTQPNPWKRPGVQPMLSPWTDNRY